ncbi:MAG TPA: transcription elongation factor GreA [Thermodesulfobacteriota bacterium]|nr:transcription elongation factor GreA [Deltaproteobacteria bacterium]HNR13025.1 transcription elongation factor GreA [Thermodesulfobacteriota bacterium]HNU72917.1 transcription elongation factor GreA [Thermodesulfobacteriota bacterium]HOC39203.1 transcription elongation factor GreA [Thermodesulfobacteriota bacterium]HQO77214.1 transcription elongation factor GreA [Thermodesulfobacteriota bacterium]
MSRRPITKEGYEVLIKELKHLKLRERPKVIQDLAAARAHGDLSENAEYDAAKERQAYIEGKISDLESRLSMAEIIDLATLPRDKVAFGAKVRLYNIDTEEEELYQLVGPDESNVEQQKISVFSPLGNALLGKRVDDTATVHAPRGIIEYEILDIIFD